MFLFDVIKIVRVENYQDFLQKCISGWRSCGRFFSARPRERLLRHVQEDRDGLVRDAPGLRRDICPGLPPNLLVGPVMRTEAQSLSDVT